MIVNGNEYAYGQVNVVLPGRTVPVEGVTEISYGMKQDKKGIYARGFKPHAIGKGNKEVTGNVKILQSEFEAMQLGIGGVFVNLLDLAGAIITVSYGDTGDVRIVTDQIIGAQFTDWKKGMKSGDTNMEIELPFVALDIALQV